MMADLDIQMSTALTLHCPATDKGSLAWHATCDGTRHARLAAAHAAECQVAYEQLQHDDGKGVHVHGLGHLALLEHLSWHVGHRAIRAGGHVCRIGLQHAAQPKVAHLPAARTLRQNLSI